MAQSRRRKPVISKSGKQNRSLPPQRPFKPPKPITLPDDAALNRRFGWFAMAVLFAFGVYLSILYFGHQVVPNSDFPAFVQTGRSILSFDLPLSFKRVPGLGMLQVALAFVQTGRSILSFDLPSSFKRVPGLGMLQVALAALVGGQHPELTAGWLLNAILYPMILVLFYLVGRQVIGKGAIWFALLAIINPGVLKWMCHPIAETTLIFFTVLSIFLIIRRSRWCYLAAAMTTMIRYEGAALIVAAFVMDMIESRSWKPRLKALLYSVLAGIPMSLWLLGMYLTRKVGATVTEMPYLKYYGQKTVFSKCTNLMWNVSIRPLVMPVPGNQEMMNQLFAFSKILLVICLVAAVVYILLKRQWHVLPLVIFLVCFYLVHASKSNVLYRYCVPVAWVILLLGCYGLRSIWLMIPGKNYVPRPVVVVVQLAAAVGALVWFVYLVRYLPKVAGYSLKSTSLPYCAMGAVILILAGYIFIYETRGLFGHIALAAITLLLIVTNHFTLVQKVGNGSMDLEFKKLANWYIKNAQSDEKMVTTMGHVVSLYAPEYKNYFVKTSRITGKSPNEFVNNCYKHGITYVAWDSRIGLARRNSYYAKWGIKHMAMLARPRDIGPFKFIDQIKHKHYPNRYIYIFRLKPLSVQPIPPPAIETPKKELHPLGIKG